MLLHIILSTYKQDKRQDLTPCFDPMLPVTLCFPIDPEKPEIPTE
jgi:hypothetical protein